VAIAERKKKKKVKFHGLFTLCFDAQEDVDLHKRGEVDVGAVKLYKGEAIKNCQHVLNSNGTTDQRARLLNQ